MCPAHAASAAGSAEPLRGLPPRLPPLLALGSIFSWLGSTLVGLGSALAELGSTLVVSGLQVRL